MQTKVKKYFPFFLSFSMPIIIFIIAFLLLPKLGVTRSILYQDPAHQYLDFLSYFKRLATGKESFFYSFDLSAGSETIALISYYLFSPFNFIALLFPDHLMHYAFFSIIIIEIGFIGLTSYYYFRKEHPRLGHYRPLIFSLGYALSAFVLGYFQHFEWLCPLIFFPLVCLGINKIVRGDKPWLYIISLSAAILTCYYIGYMICIFSVLWLAYNLVNNNNKTTRKKAIKNFCLASLLSGMISAVLLIPTFMAMFSSGTDRLTTTIFSLKNRASIGQLLLQLTSNQAYYSPLLFCGIAPITLAILYFVNHKIPRKERLASLTMLFVFLVSVSAVVFSAVWHLGSIEKGAPYRFTFVVTFFLLILGARCLETYSGINKKLGAITLTIFTALYAAQFSSQQTFTTSNFFFLLDLIGIFIVLLPRFKSDRSPNKTLIIFQIISIFCFTTHMLTMLGKWEIGVYRFDVTSQEIQDASEIISKVSEQNIDSNDFYRTEKTFLRSKNDGMMQDYHGLSSYSSSATDTVLMTFIDRASFATNVVYDNAFDGRTSFGSTPPLSAISLTGIKYIIAQNSLDLDSRYFKKIANTNNFSAYEYSLALPVGYIVDESTASTKGLSQNVLINHIANTELGQGKNIFSELDTKSVHQEIKNALASDSGYTKISDVSDGVITYKIDNPKKSNIYYQIDYEIPDGSNVIAASEMLIKNPTTGEYEHFSHLQKGAYNLGSDEYIEFAIHFFTPYIKLSEEHFFTEDESIVEELIEKLGSQPSRWFEISGDELRGEVEVTHDNQELILSIKYDAGWQIKVDGQLVQPDKAFDNLIGIKLEKGTHNIEMKYISPGWHLGLVICSTGITFLTAWFFIDRKKSHDVK